MISSENTQPIIGLQVDAETAQARTNLWLAVQARLPTDRSRRKWEIRAKRHYRRVLGFHRLPIDQMTAKQALSALAVVEALPADIEARIAVWVSKPVSALAS